MKIHMLKDERGAEDGITVKLYQKGNVYDVSESLAAVFVDQLKCAEPAIEDGGSSEEDLKKAMVPENKDAARKKKGAKDKKDESEGPEEDEEDEGKEDEK
jgi:hypothetical protein